MLIDANLSQSELNFFSSFKRMWENHDDLSNDGKENSPRTHQDITAH
jgi:hypothetical protein